MTVSLLTEAMRRRIERADSTDIVALAQTLSREICARYARACRLEDVLTLAEVLERDPDSAIDTGPLSSHFHGALRMSIPVARLARMNPDVASAIIPGDIIGQGWQAVARTAIRLRAQEIEIERANRAGDLVNAETQAAADAGEI